MGPRIDAYDQPIIRENTYVCGPGPPAPGFSHVICEVSTGYHVDGECPGNLGALTDGAPWSRRQDIAVTKPVATSTAEEEGHDDPH